MIRIRTLGPVEITVDDRPAPPELTWRKHLALLVYLARSPRRTRARDSLLGMLWADRPEPAARHSLRESLRVLRRSLGTNGLETDTTNVRLGDHVVAIDVDEFEGRWAADDWSGAAAMAQGEFMEGFAVPDAPAFEEWLAAERLGWRQRMIECLVRDGSARLAAGLALEAEAAARRALALDQHSESGCDLLLRALALRGERAAALTAWQHYEQSLRSELGVEPDPRLTQLAERVRVTRQAAPHGTLIADEAWLARRTPLVGRAAPLASAAAVWQRCRTEPRSHLLLVHGETGTGRTRMAEEISQRSRLDGAAVATFRAVPSDREEQWAGVIGLAYGGLLDAAGVSAAPPGALAAFARRVAAWADRFPGARGDQPLALGEALVEVLRSASDEQPVVLVLDDAQWTDGASLSALDAALRALAASPLLVLVSTTPHAPREEIDRLRARLDRDVPGAALELQPLGPDEIRELVSWAMPRWDAASVDRLARRLLHDSAGLPLLVTELLAAVAGGLDLHGTPTTWPQPTRTLDQSLPSDLPGALVAAVRIAFRRLSQDAQSVVAATSVLGDRVSQEQLNRAVGIGANRIAPALDEAEWQRWLVADGLGYTFVARIVRDIVASDFLTPGQKQRIRSSA